MVSLDQDGELLVIDELTKDYGRHRALDSLSLTVRPGEVVGLLGPNGSGKSTALRLIMGFLRPTSGQVRVGGYEPWTQGVAVRQQIAYLPGELRLYEQMSGRQLLAFLAGLRGRADDPARLHSLAKQFDIDLNRPLTQLSSGMKRKVALIAVLTPQVPLVILDEPTNTLDPTMRDELLQQIHAARERGQAVLFSSHVLAEVEQVCDRVAILKGGQLVHSSRIDEIRECRQVFARFRQPPLSWPNHPGCSASPLTSDLTTVIEHRGDITPLMAWLGQQSLADVRIEPAGLTPIYRRIHGEYA